MLKLVNTKLFDCLTVILIHLCLFYSSAATAVKDVKVLLEWERTEGNSSPSRDDDSTLLNPATHSSLLDDNTKLDSGLPEVSAETHSLSSPESLISTQDISSSSTRHKQCMRSNFEHGSLPFECRFSHCLCFLPVPRGEVSPAVFASVMERAASITSWFTGSPAHSQRRGRYLRGISVQKAYTWRRR